MWITPQHFHTIPASFAICHTTKLSNLNHNIPYRPSAAHSLYTASSNWEETTRLFKHSSKSFLMYTGYLYVQMIIQTPLSDSPKFIFNTVVPCIWLIFNPMPQYLTSLQGPLLPRACRTWLATLHNDINLYSFRAPPLYLLTIVATLCLMKLLVVIVHKQNSGWHMIWECSISQS